ncbi:hypothetical protein BC831DRAFT_481336 [Entophlyctis helioformis]|nr:hypothetical protein BC831DRAFT_481336 [Entophlyctis helioformis]
MPLLALHSIPVQSCPLIGPSEHPLQQPVTTRRTACWPRQSRGMRDAPRDAPRDANPSGHADASCGQCHVSAHVTSLPCSHLPHDSLRWVLSIDVSGHYADEVGGVACSQMRVRVRACLCVLVCVRVCLAHKSPMQAANPPAMAWHTSPMMRQALLRSATAASLRTAALRLPLPATTTTATTAMATRAAAAAHARSALARPFGSTARSLGGQPNDHHHAHAVDHHVAAEDEMHKEEFLAVSRSWPMEYYAPDNYHPDPLDLDTTPPPSATHEGTDLWATQSFWTFSLVAAVGLVAWYRVNESRSSNADAATNPLTKFMASYLPAFEGDVWYNWDKETIPLRQRWADDRLILQSDVSEPGERFHRFAFIDFHTRASDRFLGVEPDIDFSDVEFKPRWKENDKYFGVPYPKTDE